MRLRRQSPTARHEASPAATTQTGFGNVQVVQAGSKFSVMVCINAREADEAFTINEDKDILIGRRRAEALFPETQAVTISVRIQIRIAEGTPIREAPTAGVKRSNCRDVRMVGGSELHDG